MCKLSLNIVPNVYITLQSSFLSLAWPWSGRPLSKGNKWERLTLDWDPIWTGSQSTCHLQCPLTPHTPPPNPWSPTLSQWEWWNPGLRPNVVRLAVYLQPAMHPWHPWCSLPPLNTTLMPLPSYQWKWWDPRLGPSGWASSPPCYPQWPLTPPTSWQTLMSPTPLLAPDTPYYQNRNLVVKTRTTAGEHDMLSACWSCCCFVACTVM